MYKIKRELTIKKLRGINFILKFELDSLNILMVRKIRIRLYQRHNFHKAFIIANFDAFEQLNIDFTSKRFLEKHFTVTGSALTPGFRR